MALELTPEEQDLQELMDKISNEIFSQLGTSSMVMQKDESATEMPIKAYNDFIQKKLEEEK